MWRYPVCSRYRPGISLPFSRRHSDHHHHHHHHHINNVNGLRSRCLAAGTRLFTSGTLVYPEASARGQHHDLASYMAYAERAGVDAESPVFVGTCYEYAVTAALRPLGFDVRRVGGSSDKGIDLLGTWRVPSAPAHLPVRVLLSCKGYSTSRTARVSPQYVRELEGAQAGAPPGWRGSGVVGLLVAPRPATRGIRETLGRSRWPIGYVACSPDGALEQMLWNRRAEEEGLEGMGVAAVLDDSNPRGETQRIVLTWKGRTYLAPEDDPEKAT